MESPEPQHYSSAETTPNPEATIKLERDPSSAAIARERMAAFLFGEDPEIRDTAELAITELVSNACKHVGSGNVVIGYGIEEQAGHRVLWIEVHDDSDVMPEAPDTIPAISDLPSPENVDKELNAFLNGLPEGGMGLFAINQLAYLRFKKDLGGRGKTGLVILPMN